MCVCVRVLLQATCYGNRVKDVTVGKMSAPSPSNMSPEPHDTNVRVDTAFLTHSLQDDLVCK